MRQNAAGMPHEEAQGNMRLFADRVMPVLQRDRAFTASTNGAAASAPAVEGSSGIFAPA